MWSAVKLGPDNLPAAEGDHQENAKEDDAPPEDGWVESSSDEDKGNDIVNNNPQFDLSQDLSIQKLRQDKAKKEVKPPKVEEPKVKYDNLCSKKHPMDCLNDNPYKHMGPNVTVNCDACKNPIRTPGEEFLHCA